MLDILTSILALPAVQGALVVVVVALISWLIKRHSWVKHITNLATQAYLYAENKGLLEGLAGYDKFAPFMSKLIELYLDEHGTLPNPAVKGQAVKAMENLVLEEKK